MYIYFKVKLNFMTVCQSLCYLPLCFYSTLVSCTLPACSGEIECSVNVAVDQPDMGGDIRDEIMGQTLA